MTAPLFDGDLSVYASIERLDKMSDVELMDAAAEWMDRANFHLYGDGPSLPRPGENMGKYIISELLTRVQGRKK